MDLAQDGPSDRRFAAYGALGLTRYVDGLQQWLATSMPTDADGRLAHTLAALAFGVYAATSTLAEAILQSNVVRRRSAARIVARMKHARPRALLLEMLSDADPEVRLIAAEALIRYRSRPARDVLLALTDGDEAPHRARAVRALIAADHSFALDELRRLPVDTRARAYARCAARDACQTVSQRSGKKTSLARAYRRSEPGLRAGALAAAASRLGAKPSVLHRYQRRWTRRFGSLGQGEITMARALVGDDRTTPALTDLSGEARVGALRVLQAFASIVGVSTQIDTASAARMVEGLHAWWPALSTTERAQLLKSLGALDATASVAYARRILVDVKDSALAAAAEILQRYGTSVDAEALVNVVKDRPPSATFGPVLAAAARLCRLEAE